MNQGAVLGHEFVGVVEDAGPEVKRFKPGDRVVSSFFTSCGHCALCRKGWFNQCVDKGTFGHGEYFGGLGGGQAEYVVVPKADHTMEGIPGGMPDEQAIFVGDILSTGFFGAERAEIKPGDVVAIVGAGPVGLMATMCAQLFGPARRLVIDMVDARLEIAQELGAIPINANEVHPVECDPGSHRRHRRGLQHRVRRPDVGGRYRDPLRPGRRHHLDGWRSERGQGDFPYLRMWLKSLTFRAGWCNVQAYMRPLLDLIAAGPPPPRKDHQPPHEAGRGRGGLPDFRRPGGDEDRSHSLGKPG